MASLMKPSSRYSSYDSRSSTSSHFSDPSSSTELKHKSPVPAQASSSRALVKSKPSDLSSKLKSKPSDQNFTTMVKKFMEKRSNSSSSSKTTKVVGLVIPPDVIAEDLKRTARKGSNFGGLHRKLFGKGTSSSEKEKKEVKALTEVKGNTRTLAMVLRSERELLSLTKEQEMEISELKSKLDEKNTEVEKLKDLCLKQREEIKALKSAILFPDVVNSQLQDILEKQGSELKQAKQLIPTLQRQVTSLTGQLQCLADDLAEVKADKYSARSGYQNHGSSPRTPMYNREEASNSLEFSSGDPASPGSPDEMLLKDLNPCLTPYYAKSRSKEFEGIGYDSPQDQSFSEDKMEFGFNSYTRKLSRSSDYCQNSKTGSTGPRAARRSDETKCTYRKQMHHKIF
ncbi:structural maintenance of chromosomes protein [Trema orientale]|uniref:Structural maintenance of chromosomes protein n=1 Tax=Trema orientale TaxID=63057 RepID=A0A2P5EXK2_TREOI|nr:structural maintenance of chromosomes protein [Trema orientale]